tara:strand:+ start:20292 stop:20420 length:129 start_codon:yes stop_codon:yes gene_type:complete
MGQRMPDALVFIIIGLLVAIHAIMMVRGRMRLMMLCVPFRSV